MKHLIKTSIVLVFALLFLVGSVTAGINTILPGNTVFIGEEGLDISGPLGGDTHIGWWAPGASISGSSPGYTISITNPTQFYISPAEFGSHTGSWFHLDSSRKANGTAFTVEDPYLDIKVEDTTVNVDVTDKWVPTDDEIRFKIDTNLVAISERGAGAPPITIKIQSPDGSIYNALINQSGSTTSIENIAVSTSPFYTVPIWDTGRRATYATGTYTIWAECNVNRMNDNYDVAGKTTSSKTSLLNQDQNPLISANLPTTNPTIQMTITPTTKSTTATPSTQITQPPTTVTTVTTIPFPTTAPLLSTPAPFPTKAAGFEAILAGAAIIMGLVLSLKKE